MESSFVVIAVSIWDGQTAHVYGPFDRLAADAFEYDRNSDLGDQHHYKSFQIISADTIMSCPYGAHR